jgi:hypothetical protein
MRMKMKMKMRTKDEDEDEMRGRSPPHLTGTHYSVLCILPESIHLIIQLVRAWTWDLIDGHP